MTWNLTDDDTLAALTSTVAPPGDLESLLGDEWWAGVLSMWSTDYGFVSGDYTPSHLFQLWTHVRYSQPWQQVEETFVDADGPMALPWPEGVKQRFARLANGMDDDPSGAMQDLWYVASEWFDGYLPFFFADIAEIQASAVSEPVAVGLTLDSIDRSMVDAINQAALKSLPDAEGVDSFLPYWQLGDLVLLGDDHPSQYLQYVQENGGGEGQIYMNSKGGFASRGELLVQGHGSHHEHSDDFKTAIRRFSQKKLTFV